MTWIPVSERLPDADTVVLAYYNDGTKRGIVEASRTAGGALEHDGVVLGWSPEGWWKLLPVVGMTCLVPSPTITHWMPLPPPPTGDDDA
jgi:hypothetical protein